MIERLINVIPAEAVTEQVAFERTLHRNGTGEYRPTAVIFAHTTGKETEFLVGQSAKYPNALYWPLQGGMDDLETPNLAAVRELAEEIPRTFACPDHVTVLGGMRLAVVGKNRDGYKIGKLLIACKVPLRVMNIADLGEPDLEEIADIKGIPANKMMLQLAENVLTVPRTAKKALFTEYFARQIAKPREA